MMSIQSGLGLRLQKTATSLNSKHIQLHKKENMLRFGDQMHFIMPANLQSDLNEIIRSVPYKLEDPGDVMDSLLRPLNNVIIECGKYFEQQEGKDFIEDSRNLALLYKPFVRAIAQLDKHSRDELIILLICNDPTSGAPSEHNSEHNTNYLMELAALCIDYAGPELQLVSLLDYRDPQLKQTQKALRKIMAQRNPDLKIPYNPQREEIQKAQFNWFRFSDRLEALQGNRQLKAVMTDLKEYIDKKKDWFLCHYFDVQTHDLKKAYANDVVSEIRLHLNRLLNIPKSK